MKHSTRNTSASERTPPKRSSKFSTPQRDSITTKRKTLEPKWKKSVTDSDSQQPPKKPRFSREAAQQLRWQKEHGIIATTPQKSGGITFEEILLREANITHYSNAEPLAQCSYKDELRFRQLAFKTFCSMKGITAPIQPIIAAPTPRHYRFTSKRRIIYSREGVACVIGAKGALYPNEVVESHLDPEQHHTIYKALSQVLALPSMKFLTESLRYVIVRGYGANIAVILNVAELDATVVRVAKKIAAMLMADFCSDACTVTGVFLYHDPTQSAYYLDVQPLDDKSLRWKKLAGLPKMKLKINDVPFLVPPGSFSQVNVPILPAFIGAVRNALSRFPHDTLLDMYCGYGLFSYTLGGEYKKVFGMESQGSSLRAAIDKADHLRSNTSGIKQPQYSFLARDISENSLEALPPVRSEEVMIVDPPRSGTSQGVIAALARRSPAAVVHICCGIEELQRTLREWKVQRYTPEYIQPIDMFPGTASIETLILLTPQKK